MGTYRQLRFRNAVRWAVLGLIGIGSGCTGRTLEGRWEGPVPGFGETCRIRMDGGTRLSAVCEDLPKRGGLGKYRLEGERFTVEWQTVTENGRSVERPDSFLEARVSGPGNEMTLTPVRGGPTYVWVRRAN